MRPLKAMRSCALAAVCFILGLMLFAPLTQGLAERRLTRSLKALPDHSFTSLIADLQSQGRITEALDWACYVTNHPGLPDQALTANLVIQLKNEQSSLWLQADRVAKGFVTGSGASVEELGGAVASDMLVYGDCRDLFLQGYYRLTGKESDKVVAALASVGLLTELVDAVDWAPAVLKAFRKANAMSQRFGELLAGLCRNSAKARALDPALVQIFGDIKRLYGRLGLARSAAVFKHADNVDDLAFLAKHAEAHPGEVYRLAVMAGGDGLPLLRRYADQPRGLDLVALAVRKGAPGLDALRKGGELRHVTLFARYGERIIRSLSMQRPQQFLHSLAMSSPAARHAMWLAFCLLAAAGCWNAASVLRHLRLSPRKTPENAQT